MILILGASGYIGNYFFNGFKKQGYEVLGTYFKNKKPGMLKFDLENMDIKDIDMKNLGLENKINYIIISAAVNVNIDETKRKYSQSYNANVIKTNKILDYCFNNNIFPIYISTDNVFDGKKGNYSEGDNPNPINCYGKIKHEVEEHLIDSREPNLILRMGKVFGIKLGDKTLITSMVEDIKQEKKLSCSVDQINTPVYINDLFNFTKTSIKKNYNGVFHLASCSAITRYEIAKKIENFFNIRADIFPCKINSLGLLEKRPEKIDLNIEKYKELTGFKEKPIEYFLKLIKR